MILTLEKVRARLDSKKHVFTWEENKNENTTTFLIGENSLLVSFTEDKVTEHQNSSVLFSEMEPKKTTEENDFSWHYARYLSVWFITCFIIASYAAVTI